MLEPYFRYNRYGMTSSHQLSPSPAPKKRGRPATGKDPLIGVRFPAALTAAVDAFAAEQTPPLSRSEAVRSLVAEQLTLLGRIDPGLQATLAGNQIPATTEAQMQASAAEARSHAANALDQAMEGIDATSQEKAARRGALTDEPAVIARAQRKGQGRSAAFP